MTYKIMRMFNYKDEKDVIKEGISLDEAQAWCRRPDTRGSDWFDCYYPENEQIHNKRWRE